MTKLEKIVKAAKALRKKYPNKYSKWTDYIKAASKQVSGFEGVSRKGDKTTVHYSKKGPATKKKAAPKKATQSTLFGVKKAAPKKKGPARSSHKDTKSHNVNIRVVSGTDNDFYQRQLQMVLMRIKLHENKIVNDARYFKDAKTLSEKSFFRAQIKRSKDRIKELKKQLTLIKKSIK